MIYAYALISDASETLKSEFEDALAATINRRTDGDVIVICADVNASLGRNNPTSKNGLAYTSISSHGINYINVAGQRLRHSLEPHNVASLSTLFNRHIISTTTNSILP
jgi:hypothetical protein